MTTDYEKLTAHFDVTHQLRGLTYITGEQAVSRLNEVLGFGGWQFEILAHGSEEDHVWAHCRLTHSAGVGFPLIKEQFGSQIRQKGEYGDALKGAATDGLKKCASLIGVGLYLHEKDSPNMGATQQDGPPSRQPRDLPAKSTPAATPPANATPPAKGLTGFWAYVLKEMGYSRESVMALCQQWYENREPKDLKESEIKALIVKLEEEKKKGAAA